MLDIVIVGLYLSHKMFASIFDILKLSSPETIIKISYRYKLLKRREKRKY